MTNRKMENSVRSLANLYTVIIGVALSLAVVKLVEGSAGLKAAIVPSILLFSAFIATLFPFYHGALRHIDDAYIESDGTNIKDGALVVDLILLFVHGIVFVVLALLIAKPSEFAWILIVLLATDVLWGIFAHFAVSTSSGLSAELKWLLINFAVVGLLTWYLVANDINFRDTKNTLPLVIVVFVACVIRSIVDYISCAKFYFPK